MEAQSGCELIGSQPDHAEASSPKPKPKPKLLTPKQRKRKNEYDRNYRKERTAELNTLRAIASRFGGAQKLEQKLNEMEAEINRLQGVEREYLVLQQRLEQSKNKFVLQQGSMVNRLGDYEISETLPAAGIGTILDCEAEPIPKLDDYVVSGEGQAVGEYTSTQFFDSIFNDILDDHSDVTQNEKAIVDSMAEFESVIGESRDKTLTISCKMGGPLESFPLQDSHQAISLDGSHVISRKDIAHAPEDFSGFYTNAIYTSLLLFAGAIFIACLC